MDAAAFSLAARLLSERLAAVPDLLGAGVTRARLVCDALSADAPPLLELPLLLHITLHVLHDGDTAQLFLPPTA